MTKEQFPFLLAIIVTAGFFGLIYISVFHIVPATSAGLVDGLIGSLGTAWVSIVNYYFGSSSGSATKTALLTQQNSGTINPTTNPGPEETK